MLRGGSANPNYPAPQNDPSPPITVVLTILLLVFFLMGFFAIYFCRCMVENCLTSFQRRPSGERVGPTTPPKEGLDHSLIESFPTLVYASVKEFRIDKYGLECAICLVEFEDDSMLRLLTVCCHVFHQECIDLWLESHKTCPFCRRNLESSPPSLAEKSPVLAHREGSESVMLDQDAIRIDIHEDQVVEEKERQKEEEKEHQKEEEKEHQKEEEKEHQKEEEKERERFTRSHSTGHSIVRRREEEDRYTLRLPEHVKIKIVRGHKWTGSCTTFREFSRQRDHAAARAFGELSGSNTTTSTHATARHI